MRKIIAFLLTATLVTAMFCSCRKHHATADNDLDAIPQLANHIQQCSRLYTTDYRIHKVVMVQADKQLETSFLGVGFNVPLGERRLLIPMEATLKGYNDFSNFSEDDIESDGEKVTITLPDPEVMLTSSRIDHDGTKQYVSWYLSNFDTTEQTAHAAKGRQDIIDKVKNDSRQKQHIVEAARQNAANLLIPLISRMGFDEQNITITFRQDFSFENLKIHID